MANDSVWGLDPCKKEKVQEHCGECDDLPYGMLEEGASVENPERIDHFRKMKFRAMRRGRQQLTKEECEKVLKRNTAGVLAVLGDGGYPYAVPLSYVYYHDKIYFHCAKSGHKLDAIRNCSKVSFCVTDQDVVVPEEYTTRFCSVILFGKAQILEDEKEIRESIERLALKYAPDDSEANRQKMIEKEYGVLCMVKIDIEYMSGKKAKELIQK